MATVLVSKRPHVVTNFQRRNELFGMQGEIQAIGKPSGCAAQVIRDRLPWECALIFVAARRDLSARGLLPVRS